MNSVVMAPPLLRFDDADVASRPADARTRLQRQADGLALELLR
jgi:hypothetical protein